MNRTWLATVPLILLMGTPQIKGDRILMIDPTIAHAVHDDITQFIHDALQAHAPQDAAHLIKQQFPVIGAVVIDQRSPQSERVAIDAARPHALINDEIILASDGVTYSPNFLEPSILKTVPPVKLVADQSQVLSEIPVEIKQFLVNLAHEILKQLVIEWHHKNLIMCTNTQKNTPCRIQITDQTALNDQLIKRCTCAAQEYRKMDTIYRKNKPVILDVRFTGHIIAHQ